MSWKSLRELPKCSEILARSSGLLTQLLHVLVNIYVYTGIDILYYPTHTEEAGPRLIIRKDVFS